MGNGSEYKMETTIPDKPVKKETNSNSSVSATDIGAFIHEAENKENGKSITVNGNRLEMRYAKATGQSWIDVYSENDEGAIPSQQCSRIVPDEERKYYMLEECFHKWEYPLFPMKESS